LYRKEDIFLVEICGRGAQRGNFLQKTKKYTNTAQIGAKSERDDGEIVFKTSMHK
jgi:hypothetical protein